MAGFTGAFADALNRKYAVQEESANSERSLRDAQAAGITGALPSENALRTAQAGAAGAGARAQDAATATVQPLAQSQVGLQGAQSGFLGAQAGQIHFSTDDPATDAEIGNYHRQTTNNNDGLDAAAGIGVGPRPGYTYTKPPYSPQGFSVGTSNVQPKGAPMAQAPLPPPSPMPGPSGQPQMAAEPSTMGPGMGLFDHMQGIVHHAMHALHAAGGMTSVPSPGQTTSNGSWTGPTTGAPPPSPLGPMTPSGTPNQDLRSKMGYGVRASGGMSDVQPPTGVPPIADPVRYPDNSPDSGFGQRKPLTGTLKAAAGATTVPGKGDPGVDKVPAVLAPGEAVLNSGAANHMGRGAIAALNALGAHAMAAQGTPPQGPGAGPDPTAPPTGMMPPGKMAAPKPPQGPQQTPIARGMPKVPGKSSAPDKGKAPVMKSKVAAGGKGR